MPTICWSVLDTASNLVLLPLFLYHLVGAAFLYSFLLWLLIVPFSVHIGGLLLQAMKDKMASGNFGKQ
eukprot:6563016-Pyramimonas_sp.AAC.1